MGELIRGNFGGEDFKIRKQAETKQPKVDHLKFGELSNLLKDLPDIDEKSVSYQTKEKEVANYADEQLINAVNNYGEEDVNSRLAFYRSLVNEVQKREIKII